MTRKYTVTQSILGKLCSRIITYKPHERCKLTKLIMYDQFDLKNIYKEIQT